MADLVRRPDDPALCLLHHVQHRIVHVFLTLRKPPVDWYGATKIGVVVGVFGAKIEQYDITVFANLVIIIIMENVGICSRSDDGIIGMASRALPYKLMDNFRFNFIFFNAGFNKS